MAALPVRSVPVSAAAPVDAVMLKTSTMQIAEEEKRTNRRFRITLVESLGVGDRVDWVIARVSRASGERRLLACNSRQLAETGKQYHVAIAREKMLPATTG